MARRVGVWFAAPYKVKSRSGPVRSDRPSVRVAVTKANQPVNSCVRTSGLRATSAAPAKRGGAVGAPEGLHEVTRINVADPPADLLHRQVGLDQETPCLRHAALGDPLLHCPSRLAPYDRGEVAPRQAHRPRHVLERDALVVAILDEAEDLGEQGLVVEPEIAHDVSRQPCDAHEQERQVRKARLRLSSRSRAKKRSDHEGRSVGGTFRRWAPPAAPLTKGKSSGCARQERKAPGARGPRTSGGKKTAQPSATLRPLASPTPTTSPGAMTCASPASIRHSRFPNHIEPPPRSK